MSFRYEWDEEKYSINLQKHGIRFDEAIQVFSDSNALELIDQSQFEERFIRIGLCFFKGILVVVYCERDEKTIRIISARKATKQEEKNYEERIRF